VNRRALLVLIAVLALAGCSSSDHATTTAAPTTTTTTEPEITDEEIIANINEQLKPALEAAFDGDTAACVLKVLEDGGTGELDADAVVPAYEERCGVTATKVTGVVTAAALVEQGAAEDHAACVADAIAALSYDQVSALGEDGTNALYRRCGIDPEALGGD